MLNKQAIIHNYKAACAQPFRSARKRDPFVFLVGVAHSSSLTACSAAASSGAAGGGRCGGQGAGTGAGTEDGRGAAPRYLLPEPLQLCDACGPLALHKGPNRAVPAHGSQSEGAYEILWSAPDPND